MSHVSATNDTDLIALETLKLFRVIFKSANRHFHAIEKTVGIGGASLWALAAVAEAEGAMTVSNLAQAMSIHQSTASNLIERLVKDGYLQKQKSDDDRRVVWLALTDAGHEMLSRAPLPHKGVLPDALMRLDSESLAILNHYLHQLIDVMQQTYADAAFEPLGSS